MCDGDVLLPDHLPAEIAAGDRSGPPPLERWAARAKPPRPTTLPENEREMIVEALRDNFWNQTQAAATLGISRDNLRYRIKKYDIRRDR
jgi:DNA-binding NtrC family response regulator